MLGEHGTSQVFVWSSARIAGVPLHAALGQGEEEAKKFRKRIEQEVRYANITIIEGTGASQLGIGLAVARITEMILRTNGRRSRSESTIPGTALRSRCPPLSAVPGPRGFLYPT